MVQARPVAACSKVAEPPNAEEQAALADAADIMEAVVGYLPLNIAEFEAASLAPDENRTDAAALARIGLPVLAICGDRSMQA